MFYFESQRFNLENNLTYKPDFILPKSKIHDKQVILEPHGIWTPEHTIQVTTKYKQFREMFGKHYYLILLVQPNVYYQIRDKYPESYDDIVESNRMGDLLFMLKKGHYHPIFQST